MATLRWRRKLLPSLVLVALIVPFVRGCEDGCSRYQYCDENSNRCSNCSLLCKKDEYSCFHKCQNYLFKSFRDQMTSLEGTIATMKVLLSVFISLFCVAVILLTLQYRSAISECCRWRPQGKKTAPVGYTHENPNTKSPKVTPKNGANVAKLAPRSTTVSICPETEAEHSVQTGTTSISNRHPAEDSTESYSYDNAACNVTPTSNISMPKL